MAVPWSKSNEENRLPAEKEKQKGKIKSYGN